MSFLDQMLDAAKKRVLTKIENPRAVQTAEQTQVSVQQQTGVSRAAPSAATVAGTTSTGLMSKIPGGHKTLMILGGSIVGFVVLKKLKVI